MNYLMHLYLSGNDREILVGNLMGDFVKGRLDDRYPSGIRQGIVLHRKIDSFAAGNPHFLLSKRRIDPSFRHYRGVLVDVFYDHFLAQHWDEFSSTPYPEYIRTCYETVSAHREEVPDQLRPLIPRIFSEDWLLSYPYREGIAAILQRMSRRGRQPNPLAAGIGELSREYGSLLDDYRLFLPEISEYVTMLREMMGEETG